MGADVSEMVVLSERVKKAGSRVGKRGAAALRKTAFDITADAQLLAPVDTGHLMNSILPTFAGDGRSAAMTAEITAHADYSAYVEFGTSTTAPQPFMQPALERRLPGFKAAVAQIGAETLLD